MPPKPPRPPKPPKPPKRSEPHPFLIKLTIAPDHAFLQVGDTQQFTVTAYFSDGSSRDWTRIAHYKSSNPDIVSVDGMGLAKVISSGEVEITASFGPFRATASIEVQAVAVLISISISPATVSLQVGDTQPFIVTGQFSDGSTQDFTTQAGYSSSDASAVTVNGTGLATALALGSAMITATVFGFSTTATAEVHTIVAPPADMSVATTVFAASEFLYTGPDAVQIGVAPGTIELQRATVLRGRVLTLDGAPLSGVTISIHDHPQFGQTVTREDGQFDMAVNGGDLLFVNYEKEGLLPEQRQVIPFEGGPNRQQLPVQSGVYLVLPDVVMITLNPAVTTIDLFQPNFQTDDEESYSDDIEESSSDE